MSEVIANDSDYIVTDENKKSDPSLSNNNFGFSRKKKKRKQCSALTVIIIQWK